METTKKGVLGNMKIVKYGDTELFRFDELCRKPTLTKPTTGEHDYKTCADCQNTLKIVAEAIEKQHAKFPNCCATHKALQAEKWFNKEDYKDSALHVSTKVVYTRQHILNNINKEDWYKEITDYIEYTVESFASFAKAGRLYLNAYFNYIRQFLLQNTSIFTPEKVKNITQWINDSYCSKTATDTDFTMLLNTYEQWLNLFPFEISFFRELKATYQKNVPFISGELTKNKYMPFAKAKLHTRKSQIDVLLELTNSLLTTVNTYCLYDKGLLKDIDKVKLEMVIADRKNSLKIGYLNNDNEIDSRFRRMLKDWFRQEKKFIDEIRPFFESKQTEQQMDYEQVKIKQLREALEAMGFASLPMVKEIFNKANYSKIFDLFSKNKAPYQIAMLHYLGFLEHLFQNDTRESVYRQIATILKAKQRVIKGNCLVLNPKSTESRKLYTSITHIKEVEKDYQNIKLG